jgi:hypothetical protein
MPKAARVGLRTERVEVACRYQSANSGRAQSEGIYVCKITIYTSQCPASRVQCRGSGESDREHRIRRAEHLKLNVYTSSARQPPLFQNPLPAHLHTGREGSRSAEFRDCLSLVGQVDHAVDRGSGRCRSDVDSSLLWSLAEQYVGAAEKRGHSRGGLVERHGPNALLAGWLRWMMGGLVSEVGEDREEFGYCRRYFVKPGSQLMGPVVRRFVSGSSSDVVSRDGAQNFVNPANLDPAHSPLPKYSRRPVQRRRSF